MTSPLRCISWIAVSSVPQTEKESPEEQRAGNAQIVAQVGGQLVAELEVPGHTRDYISFERACEEMSAYASLNDLLQRRGADLLICRDLSRLGRTQALIAQVAAHCMSAGIALYPRNAPPATIVAAEQAASDGHLLMTAINASFAEIEKNNFKRRWQYGMKGRVERGDFLNRAPYGYYAVRDSRGRLLGWAVDETQAAAVRYGLIDLYLRRGMALAAVAAGLQAAGFAPPRHDHWNAAVVGGLLRYVERYAGQLTVRLQSGTIQTRGRYPAILGDAEVAQLRAEQVRRGGGRRSWRNYLFSQTVICAGCGKGLWANYTDPTPPYNRYYRCRTCHVNVNDRQLLEELRRAVAFVRDHSNREDILEQTPDETQRIDAELAAVERRRAAVERQRKKLTRAYSLDEIDEGEYRALMAETVAQRTQIDARAEQLAQLRLDAVSAALRGARLDEIAEHGQRMLDIIQAAPLGQDETRAVNAWIHRLLRFVVADNRVVRVEFL